uniref:Dynein assembly factor 1, axonemal homolog n=1 Tax=Phytophthora ramorum TaxID=164328 RepID=H3HCP3_PHYRM
MEMEKTLLKKLCRDNDLIKNLDEYTGLKVLWLEGNGLPRIEGLENQKELRTLYLHENLIHQIEGLESQLLLDTLNLSQNQISCIANLGHLKQLTSLALKSNYLTSAKDIAHVLELPNLSVLDIQSNRINDVDIVDILAQMPNLKVLYLQGNEVVKHIKQYRKTMVYRCRKLKYLDDRPVFDDERRRVEAWGKALEAAGGDMKAAQEAERVEMDAIRREKKERDEKNFLYFEQMMIEGRRKRREEEERKRKAENPEGGEEQSNEEINPFSGEKIVPVQDCAFLQQEHFGGNNTSDEDNQETEPSTDYTASTGVIPVDERRMNVLHQCATVGAASASGKDAFVNASFQVSQAGSGGIGEIPAAVVPASSNTEGVIREGSTAQAELKPVQADNINEATPIDNLPIPPIMVMPPPAPVIAAPQSPPMVSDDAPMAQLGEGSDDEAHEMAEQEKLPPAHEVDANENLASFLLPPPPPPLTSIEQAEEVAQTPSPPTHTDVNELD